jgi:uncharacterized protein YbjT (DUF2867 family)
MKIAVAGGTGVIGSAVALVASERGHEVRVLSRSTGVDVQTGSGLDAALEGMDAVIDVLSIQTQSAKRAKTFFEASTANLLAAEEQAGVRHHLALSIVGVDRAPHGYYGAKYRQEQLIEQGAVPWTILRATQFHDFAGQILGRSSFGPIHPVVRMRTQPIDKELVAARLIDLAEAGPSGRARDLAGPQEENLGDMIRAWTVHRGIRGIKIPMALPGAFGKAMRDGRLLPGPDAELVGPTFAQWLKDQPAS